MLHCLSPAVQCIFNTLPGQHKSLKEAKTALNRYFAPKWNLVAERYKFRSRAQKADESFDAYLTSLQELVKSCDFGTLEEEMIRDQTVEKSSSQTLKQKLLQQEDLHLSKTVRIAWNAETAMQEARLLSQGTRENMIQIDHVHASWGSQAKLSAATDVVEQTDMLLTNVARSSPGVISAKESDTCRGFAVQSPKLTRGKARKEKKRTHPRRSAA